MLAAMWKKEKWLNVERSIGEHKVSAGRQETVTAGNSHNGKQPQWETATTGNSHSGKQLKQETATMGKRREQLQQEKVTKEKNKERPQWETATTGNSYNGKQYERTDLLEAGLAVKYLIMERCRDGTLQQQNTMKLAAMIPGKTNTEGQDHCNNVY